jgi:hypothetical protein
MMRVHRTVLTCTVLTHCTLYSILYTHTLYSILYTLYSHTVLYTLYSRRCCTVCTICVLAVHSLCTHYPLTIHSLSTHYPLTIHSLSTHYSRRMRSWRSCSQYTLTRPSLYTIHCSHAGCAAGGIVLSRARPLFSPHGGMGRDTRTAV